MASSEEGKEDFVVVVKDLEKTITAQSHLDCLLDVNTLGPGQIIDDNQTPMIRITYEELDLSGIEAAYRNKKDLLPLRNFLVGKKKGQDKNKCAFGLYCLAKVKGAGDDAAYYLQVDNNLFDKVYNESPPEISAEIKICGLTEEPVLLENGVRYNDRAFELICKRTEAGFIVTKKDLQEEKKMVTFRFTVQIKCIPHWNYGWFHIGSGKTKSILQNMYDFPDSSRDVTIVAADGDEVKAHKIVLMAHSPVFYSMLSSDNATAEAQTGRILMEGNSGEGVTQMVRYLYGLRLEVDSFSPDLAVEVFQLSHKYELKELERDMTDLLTEKGMEWYYVDSLLELYFYVKNNEDFEELRAHALTELADGLSHNALTESDFFKRLDENGRINLLFTLLSWSRIKV